MRNIVRCHARSFGLSGDSGIRKSANQADSSFDELLVLGKKIVQQVDREESGKVSDAVNSLLMNFENRIYKIDEFLDKVRSTIAGSIEFGAGSIDFLEIY